MGRLPDCGSPSVEQHIHDPGWPVRVPLAARLFLRHLLDAERPANHTGDN